MHLDLVFPVYGDILAGEHYYLLYAGLSRLIRDFHTPEGGLRFTAINGERKTRGLLHIAPHSRLRVRLPAEKIATALPLAGQFLAVGDHQIRLGNPTVFPLVPATVLATKIVTFKHGEEPGYFIEVARQRLRELGIEGEPGIPLSEKGPGAGLPRRQVIRVKGVRIVGYPLRVAALTAEESIRLQECGLGGRTRMGCGFFLPYRPRAA
jgi:CRISPR-associated protein Cas6